MAVVVVDSGKLVSSAFVIRGDRAFTVHCPSQSTGYALFAEFSLTSGTAPWNRLLEGDGSGLAFCVASGAGNVVGIVPIAPTSYARLAVTSGASSPMSFTILEVPR